MRPERGPPRPAAFARLGAVRQAPAWGGYTVEETARRHDVSVEQDTTDAEQAYARFAQRRPARYREGWLPE
ncbi:MAG: hypothetical protein ABR583_08575 [Gaiellaceae bacterium]